MSMNKLGWLNKMLDVYTWIVARPYLEKFNLLVLLMGMRGLGIRNFGVPYLSGEAHFLRKMLSELDRPGAVMVDVGANEGGVVENVIRHSQHMNVVAIEPHPHTFSRLSARHEGNNRVRVVNCAAGEAKGSMPLFDYSNCDGSEHASMFREVIEETHKGTAREFSVQVHRLDDLLAGELDRICVLKIDVEGFELHVLKGARMLTSRTNLKVVVLEFNEMNVNSRTFLKNVIDCLKEFTPYRILPGGKLLSLDSYSAWRVELFSYQNIAFLRRPNKDG